MEQFYFTYFLMAWSGLEEGTYFVLFSPLSQVGGKQKSSFLGTCSVCQNALSGNFLNRWFQQFP